jgi:hypothetical protein
LRMVDPAISRLRRKLEKDPVAPILSDRTAYRLSLVSTGLTSSTFGTQDSRARTGSDHGRVQ